MANINVLGIFKDSRPVRDAIDELNDAGFTDDQIEVVSHNESLARETTGSQGFLSRIFSGMTDTDRTSVRQSLRDLGLDARQVESIDDQIAEDGAVVAVHADGRRAEAMSILNRFTAMGDGGDVESGTFEREAELEADRTVELHEEKLDVEKSAEEVGEVVARKEVRTEQRTIEVHVQREEVVIERHRVPEGERELAPGETEIREGEEIRIPVREEQVEVEKTPVVSEEVTIGKRKTTDEEKVQETLRKEELRVDQEGQADVRTTNERKGEKR